MPDDQYSLAELARLAGVTPRTVRYYVAQGLLRSPDAAGPATRYSEGHLARLRLIRRLQRDHLPLAEIRGRLERMGDADVEAALRAGEREEAPAASPDDTLAYVQALMARSGMTARVAPSPTPTLAEDFPPMRPAAVARPPSSAPHRSLLRRIPDEFPMREDPGATPPTEPVPGVPAAPPMVAIPPILPAPPQNPATPPDRSTWERLSITPDVELHVRRPLERTANKRVERLVRIARELFEEDL